MSAYIVLDVQVQNFEAYEEYKQLVPPIITAYGGRYLARGGRTQILEGAWQPSRLVILEFPTVERAKAWWGSHEYEAAKKLRQAAARTEMVLIEGL